jgi:DNA-binding IclR family transcriptional regulator
VIDDVLDGYRNYQTLSVALELDVFEEIAENGPSSARDIADAALVNRMFIRIILTALEDMGLLKSNQDKYFLTEPTETFLLQRNPLY